MMLCMLNVFKVREFKRKNGEIGQEIVCFTDDGYMCRVACVDKSVKDFSSIKAGLNEFEVETCYQFVRATTDKGIFNQNYITLRVIG